MQIKSIIFFFTFFKLGNCISEKIDEAKNTTEIKEKKIIDSRLTNV